MRCEAKNILSKPKAKPESWGVLTNGGHGEEVQVPDETEKSRKREGVRRAAQKTSFENRGRE